MQMFNRVAVSNVLVAALIFMAAPAQAVVEAGKIIYSRGVVSIVDIQDSARGGKSGAKIFEGDRVVTGRGALAQIRLSDGALIALRGSSDYQIEKQSYGEDEDLYEQAGKLFTGWMRSITGTIGKKYPKKVSQSTSVATIGIRGTVYQVIHIPPEGLPGYAGEEPGTYVLLEEGAVELSGEGGKRLLKPGDVVFVPMAGGAPKLVPLKKKLFQNAEDGVIEFVEAEELDFSQDVNETLTETLGKGIFPNFAFAGFLEGIQYNSDSVSNPYFGPTIAGTGANRRLTSMREDVEGLVIYKADDGATPSDTGHHVLANGSEINWGTWASSDYKVDYGGGDIASGNGDWKYMIGSNFIDLVNVSSVTGTATYNYVGGSHLVDNVGNIVASIDNSSFISFDFGNSGAEISNLGIVTDNIGTLGCSSICGGLSSLQQGGIFIDDGGAGTYTGTLGGTFVGNGAGLMTTIDLNNGTVTGTAAFETNTPPTYIPALVEVGQ